MPENAQELRTPGESNPLGDLGKPKEVSPKETSSALQLRFADESLQNSP